MSSTSRYGFDENLLQAYPVEDSLRAGFVAALILAKTNESWSEMVKKLNDDFPLFQCSPSAWFKALRLFLSLHKPAFIVPEYRFRETNKMEDPRLPHFFGELRCIHDSFPIPIMKPTGCTTEYFCVNHGCNCVKLQVIINAWEDFAVHCSPAEPGATNDKTIFHRHTNFTHNEDELLLADTAYSAAPHVSRHGSFQ